MITFSKRTQQLAQNIVSNYANYDKLARCYVMDINGVAEFDLQKLASFIYLDNPDFANESTGPDNASYDSKMLPALLIYLKNTMSHNARMDFLAAWTNGVTNHAYGTMKDLLEETLDVYNQDHDEAA